MSNVMVKGRFVGGGLFEMKEGKNKFSACIALEDGEEEKVNALIEAAVTDKWGSKKPKGMETHGCKMGDDEDYPTFEKWFINPKNKMPVTVVRKSKEGVLHEVTKESGTVYPGCFVGAEISAFAYDGNGKDIKPGVTLSLQGVCFWKTGDKLSSVGISDDSFNDLDAEETEEVEVEGAFN